MHQAFKKALEDGQVEPALGPNGGPFEIDGKRLYLATDSGINMMMGRFYAFSDMLRKHDTLKLTDDSMTTALMQMRDMQRRAMAQMAIDPEQAMDCLRESLTIIERIQERRKLGLDMAQVFDIAAIWYMTEAEDPGTYDPTIGRWKIAEWLKSPELFESSSA